MLMPGRVQGWPAGTQRAANAAERLLSQAVAWWDVGQYRDGDRFLRNRGTGGELLDLRLGSAAVANSNDPRFLAPEDTGYVYLPGVAGNFLSVPDEAALDITGDIDIRVLATLDDWTPSGEYALVSKWTGTTATNAFYVRVRSTGTVDFQFVSGGVQYARASTVATGIVDGGTAWVRVTVDVDNGASGHDVKFYTSVDGSSWSQVGSTVTTAGTITLNTNDAALQIGALIGTTFPTSGKIHRAVIYSDLTETTKVLDIDCDAITSGSATSFTAGTGQTVAITRTTSGRKSVAVPSSHKSGRPVMLLGTDDFLVIPDESGWQHGLLNFQQGESFTVLIAFRQWATPAAAGRYISKELSAGSLFTGYGLRNSDASNYRVDIDDGPNSALRGAAYTNGAVTMLVTAVDRSAQLLRAYNGTVPTAATSIASVGSLANTVPFRVGRLSDSTSYQDFELYAAAAWRRCLSPAEITLLSNYFTGRIA